MLASSVSRHSSLRSLCPLSPMTSKRSLSNYSCLLREPWGANVKITLGEDIIKRLQK